MPLNMLVFDPNTIQYRIAILIKDRALRQQEILQNYVEPLLSRGFRAHEVLALNLQYNDQDKAPVKLIKEHLDQIHKVLDKYAIKHVLVADAAYFKTMCKVRKAEPHYGYVLPTIWPGIQAALTINYMQLFHNPSLNQRLFLGIEAIVRDMQGDKPLFKEDIFGNVEFPTTREEIVKALTSLLGYPALTCDIETEGLHLRKSRLLSIAFAWNNRDGIAFRIGMLGAKEQIPELLKWFFKQYTGTLIYHNASFDIGRLIYNIFMDHSRDIQGMLDGLQCMYKNTEDTQLLAYLGTNTTAGNKLSLKDLAFEHTGNYALDTMDHIATMDSESLLRYNLTDALATWFVYGKYKPIVEKEQKSTYENVFRPALKTITQMELCGIPLDSKQVDSTARELFEIREDFLRKIKDDPIVVIFEKKLKLQAVLDANAKLKRKRKTEEDFEGLEFNPRSNTQLRALLYEELKLPILRYTDTKLASTDKKTLDALIQYLKNQYKL